MKVFFLMIFFLQSCVLYGTPDVRLAFDIGTGKIKMQVVKVTGTQIETLYYQSEATSLVGKSLLDGNNMISKEGEERIITILQALKFTGEQYAPTSHTAIATELFRKAGNGQKIIEEIANLLNMEIRIISPEEEGILGFLTIVKESDLASENIIVLDIGSGSFQITCKIDGRLRVYSTPYGRFPMHEMLIQNDFSALDTALKNISPEIINKIRCSEGAVIGIGAHPKQVLKLNCSYTMNDLLRALEANPDVSLDRSDLILMKKIMEFLDISRINFLGTQAGITGGIFIKQLEKAG